MSAAKQQIDKSYGQFLDQELVLFLTAPGRVPIFKRRTSSEQAGIPDKSAPGGSRSIGRGSSPGTHIYIYIHICVCIYIYVYIHTYTLYNMIQYDIIYYNITHSIIYQPSPAQDLVERPHLRRQGLPHGPDAASAELSITLSYHNILYYII